MAHSDKQQMDKDNQVIKRLKIREQALLKQLRINKTLNTRILDALPFTIFLEDAEGRLTFANKHAVTRFGVALEQLLGRSKYEFFPPAVAESFRQYDLEVWKTKKFITKEEVIEYQGSKTYAFTGKTIIDADGEGEERLLGFSIDITSRVKAEQLLQESAERIRHMAYHDALTDLPNRRFIMQYAEDLLMASSSNENRPSHAVMIMDLDNFKVINDSLGHQAGDQLLQLVALRLQNGKSPSDILARLGGDEFIFLVTDLKSSENIHAVCAAINRAMEEPFYLNDKMVTISTSIGVSVYPDHGTDIHTLLKHADIAMYGSKNQGKNGYQLFQGAMVDPANARLRTETLLRWALDRNHFFVQYQPKINLESGTVTGFEALIRCIDEQGQTFEPNIFIPIAEETGLIYAMDAWILREACLACKEWNEKAEHPLSISVNLSARQFNSHGLEQRIRHVLQETGLPPHLLELELTESTVMQNPLEAAKTLRQLKEIGLSLSIDDFGTGFSSLSHLVDFSIDTLKIDRSFIRQTPTDPARSTVSSTIISLARNLNLTVIAEGVETQAQLDFLQDHRCDAVQGYYFCRPIDPDQVIRFVQSFKYSGPDLRA